MPELTKTQVYNALQPDFMEVSLLTDFLATIGIGRMKHDGKWRIIFGQEVVWEENKSVDNQ